MQDLYWNENKAKNLTITTSSRQVPNYVLTGFCELEAKIYLISVTLDKLLPGSRLTSVTGTTDDRLPTYK